MDPTAQWVSVDSSESTTETINITLYDGTLLASRSIDFVALLNINLKAFTVSYSDDGVTYTAFTGGTQTVNAGTNFVLSLATPVTASYLRLTMDTTIGAVADKLVGCFIAALGTFQTTNGMTAYDPERMEKRTEVKMADGSMSYGYIYRSDASYEFYKAKAGWRFVTAAQRTSFRTVKNTAAPFLWYPEPADAPADLYLCVMKAGSFEDPYSTTYKGAGYDIDLEVTEVGGA